MAGADQTGHRALVRTRGHTYRECGTKSLCPRARDRDPRRGARARRTQCGARGERSRAKSLFERARARVAVERLVEPALGCEHLAEGAIRRSLEQRSAVGDQEQARERGDVRLELARGLRVPGERARLGDVAQRERPAPVAPERGEIVARELSEESAGSVELAERRARRSSDAAIGLCLAGHVRRKRFHRVGHLGEPTLLEARGRDDRVEV